MDDRDLSRALHVIGSGGAAGELRSALHLSRDRVLVSEDFISCGEAPATDDLGLWRSARERANLQRLDGPDFSFDDHAETGLLMNAARLGEKSPVVVWAGIGLPEQLLLAWVVFLSDLQGFDPSNLHVVQFETRLPRQRVLSIAELSADDIQAFRPEPRPLTSAALDELRRAWRVFTASDPAALSAYAAQPGPMPLVHRALRRLVRRYPDIDSGLGVWDQRLLHHTREKGPRVVTVIGHTMAGLFDLDYVGDDHLFYRLVGLANADLAAPLIAMTGNSQAMRECEANLTPFGEKVLAGGANHVEINGIDEWIGGVHLGGEGPMTFRKDDTLILPP